MRDIDVHIDDIFPVRGCDTATDSFSHGDLIMAIVSHSGEKTRISSVARALLENIANSNNIHPGTHNFRLVHAIRVGHNLFPVSFP
jgi:hypothetical protein